MRIFHDCPTLVQITEDGSFLSDSCSQLISRKAWHFLPPRGNEPTCRQTLGHAAAGWDNFIIFTSNQTKDPQSILSGQHDNIYNGQCVCAPRHVKVKYYCSEINSCQTGPAERGVSLVLVIWSFCCVWLKYTSVSLYAVIQFQQLLKNTTWTSASKCKISVRGTLLSYLRYFLAYI